MRQTLSIIFFLIALVCHSQPNEKQWVKLNEFAKEKYKNDILEKNPLILVDGKVVGPLSEIDLKDFKINPKHPSSLQVLPKGSIYLQSIWGKYAKNGVINIQNHLPLCYGSNRPKHKIILNDNETTWENIYQLQGKDIKDWIEIFTTIDLQGNILNLTVVNTKKEKE
ncbi:MULTISPECIES: hypothetical protein [Flavobacterium]|uniref:hypothetical protein n=1 Tax=Flavobacterium TaxID=237 RepID=UPI001FCC62DB|nr:MULTISPECIES: hypothetical protein [Flavobacterium]UOK41607.1 hypothetical protein LZF87_09820 [Flavobacterium enshiense]